MDEALAELAAYFGRRAVVPDQELVRLTATARAGGSRWGCHRRRVRRPGLSGHHLGGQPGLLGRLRDRGGAAVRFRPVLPAHANRERQPVSCAVLGLPRVRAAGHRPRSGWPDGPCRAWPRAGLRPLAADQAAEEEERRERLARLIVHSETPAGQVQRHWLAERIADDCPRCGWHGYFHHYIATVGTSQPSAGTGAPRSAATTTPTCTRTSRSPSGTSRLARPSTGSPSP